MNSWEKDEDLEGHEICFGDKHLHKALYFISTLMLCEAVFALLKRKNLLSG